MIQPFSAFNCVLNVAVSTAIVSCMHRSCLRSRPAGQVRGRGPIKAAGSAPLVIRLPTVERERRVLSGSEREGREGRVESEKAREREKGEKGEKGEKSERGEKSEKAS